MINPKVAIVHDYLREFGGAERVVEVLHELFPEAPIYTAYYRPEGLGPHSKRVAKWDIRTSWLQKIPLANQLLSPLRLLAPMAFESFDLREYEVVISSSAIYFAKAVITGPQTLHLAYIHTPPKYLYGYATSFNYKKHWWTKIGAEVSNHFLRLWDYETSQRADVLVANSQNVAGRIKKFYRREPVVIYPPVEVTELEEKSAKVRNINGQRSYFLALGRLWKGKGVDIVVEACSQVGLPLKVSGTGPELANLQKRADATIEFVGHADDEQRIKLYTNAKALIVATEEEDFGMTVVEAAACGTPVIALSEGGYLETVIPGKTGQFFDRGETKEETIENLKKVLLNFDGQKYSVEVCQKHAQIFAKEHFQDQILKLIDSQLRKR